MCHEGMENALRTVLAAVDAFDEGNVFPFLRLCSRRNGRLRGMALDFGSVVYSQKKLQASTDTAALAAAFDLVQSRINSDQRTRGDGPSAAIIEEMEFGTYIDDPSVAATDRFVDGAPGNAFPAGHKYEVPLKFIQLFTGSSTFAVSASAIAYNLPLAGLRSGLPWPIRISIS